jgi:hypothetical protein
MAKKEVFWGEFWIEKSVIQKHGEWVLEGKESGSEKGPKS